MRPVLFITDITADPTCTAGDQQHGGAPYYPVAIFGSWKTASENGTIGQPTGGDPASNGWNLGPGADPVPASVMSVCGGGSGYGAELQFAAGLIPGHSYRLQTNLHDGDQTRGADSGEGLRDFLRIRRCSVPARVRCMHEQRELLLGSDVQQRCVWALFRRRHHQMSRHVIKR